MWGIVNNNEVVEVVREPRGVTINEIQYPESIFRLWTLDELVQIGIYPVTQATYPADTSIIVTNTTYEFDQESSSIIENLVTITKSSEVLEREQRQKLYGEALQELSNTDKDMARVGEEIISLLITKGVISTNDLSQEIKDKLLNRAELRQQLEDNTPPEVI